MYKHRVLDMLNPLEGRNWILQWLIVALPKISTLFVDGVEINVRVGVNNNYISEWRYLYLENLRFFIIPTAMGIFDRTRSYSGV